jgi:hypothetical protein
MKRHFVTRNIVDRVIESANEDYWYVRQQSVHALGYLARYGKKHLGMSYIFSPDPEEFRESVVQSLVKSLDDRDEDVRRLAIELVTQLMKIGMNTSSLVFHINAHCTQEDLWTKGMMTDDQLAKIINKLRDSYGNVRQECAKSIIKLAEIGRLSFMSPLHDLMEE